MLKKLMPIVLLIIGSGAGVGAGIFLRPVPTEMAEDAHAKTDAEHSNEEGTHKGDETHGAKDKDDHAKMAGDSQDEKQEVDESTLEYAKLSNQFVIPIVKDKNVASLVVLTLSIEVPAGQKDTVFRREPKIRDSMLRVLFDHANIGGFDGAFTEASMLDGLRSALKEVAQRDLGSDVVNDVLIQEIARQDL